MQKLLAKGADPNKTTKDGWNALHCAAECGNIEALQRMITLKIDPNAENNNTTALELAVQNNQWGAAEFL